MKMLPKLNKKQWLLPGVAVLVFLTTMVRIENGQQKWASWTGFGEDVEISETLEKNPQGQIIKTTTTQRFQSGKTLWDLLGVLGVPLALAALGFWFQQLQQKQSDEVAKEEALQDYFDRISELLLDKGVMGIAAKCNQTASNSLANNLTDEQKELMDVAKDVIRARTLSILRRLKGDGRRKASAILFLIETEVLSKLQIDLSNADLRFAKLMGADLTGMNFSEANLSNSNLHSSNLSGTKLMGTDLSGADLSDAILSDATLNFAKLKGANLSCTNLNSANFWFADLSRANLKGADLSGTNLSGVKFQDAILFNSNLRSSIGLAQEQLMGSNPPLLCGTELPPGMENLSNRDCDRLPKV